MKLITTAVVYIITLSTLFSQQNIDDILSEVEKNNTQLIALQKQMEAGQLANRTGIFLPNPEFEIAWSEGSPETLGDKTEISLVQHFDFPTVYSLRSRIANQRNEQLKLEYEQKRMEILHDVRMILLKVIYYNQLNENYSRRLNDAQRLVDAYALMIQEGHTNIIEYNKTRLNYLNLKKETENAVIERTALMMELKAFNGGREISFLQSFFPQENPTLDFEDWYNQRAENNPLLKWYRHEGDLSLQLEKLQRAENLPSFQVGYVSETLIDEQFKGIQGGITIPLWENKNTMKYARANTAALKNAEEDFRLRYFNQLKSLHQKATTLSTSIEEYRNILQQLDNKELLNTAWQQGELSLTNYITELEYYYKGQDSLLEMELELHQTLATMNMYMR